MKTSSMRRKNKGRKLKKEQHVSLRISNDVVEDFTPNKFTSRNLRLVPTNIVKAIEYLLYLKPTISRLGEGLTTFNGGGSGNVLKQNILKNPGRSIMTISEAKKMKGFEFFQNYTSLQGLGKQVIGLESNANKDTDNIARGSSLFHIRTSPWPEKKKRKSTFSVVIGETPTIFLHVFQSRAAIEGTEQAKQIIKHNESYWNSVRTYKKMYNAEAQTPSPMIVHRIVSMSSKNTRSDSKIQASFADIYDSSIMQGDKRLYLKKSEDDGSEVKKKKSIEGTIKVNKDDEQSEFNEACRMVDVIESAEFVNSFINLLRTVDRTVNSTKQMIFRKGSALNPLSEKCTISYDIHHLWTLRFVKVWGMPVTSLCINPANVNIVAVGHGMYFLDQPQHLGRICIWNLKNCSHPEKYVEFCDGVTSICFSRKHPFALLVSLINGGVKIVDISKSKIEVLISFPPDSSYEPIWQVKWFTFDSGNEEPIACGDSGNVYLFLKDSFSRKVFVTLCRKEGIMKGITIPSHCNKPKPVSNKTSVTSIATIPENVYNYLVGTDDGCVHLCSTDYYHEHTDVFQAHIGPVHQIKFHPDCSKIFLTVGADYCVRVWAHGVFQPLVYLQEFEFNIEDADWSPVNPNIIVTVGSNKVSIYDISRLRLISQSSITSPTGARFTSVFFTSNGSNLICGDLSGDVHVYSLSHMPFRYINKLNVLRRTFQRLLLGKKDLYDKLRSIGPPFDI